MARPSKYTQQFIDKTKEYLLNYKEHNQVVPSIAGLSNYLGIARSTLYDHAEKHKQFRDILDEVKKTQELELFNGALTGKLNPVISKLMLTKHGYSDKVEQDVTTSEKPSIEISFEKPKDNQEDKKLKLVK